MQKDNNKWNLKINLKCELETAEDWILQTIFGTPNPTSWDRKCLKRFDFWRHTKLRDEIYKFIFYFPSKTEI